MKKLAIPFALTAVALLAACAHRADPAPVVVVPQQQPAVVAAPSTPTVVMAQTAQLRPGNGRVESISSVPTAAGAGGSSNSNMRRLTVKMEDGTVQYVDTDSPQSIGDRVQLTGDGYIRPAP
jgi:hypothetical protein